MNTDKQNLESAIRKVGNGFNDSAILNDRKHFFYQTLYNIIMNHDGFENL